MLQRPGSTALEATKCIPRAADPAGFLPILRRLAACIAFASSIHAAEDVHVGIVNSSMHAPFFMADAKGYFAEEGLHVDLLNFRCCRKDGAGAWEPANSMPAAAQFPLHCTMLWRAEMTSRLSPTRPTILRGRGHAALLVRKALIDSGKFKDFKDLQGSQGGAVGCRDERRIGAERSAQARWFEMGGQRSRLHGISATSCRFCEWGNRRSDHRRADSHQHVEDRQRRCVFRASANSIRTSKAPA